jgi:hypothetical protein
MASSNANFRGGDDHRKARELEEARKAGLAPAERDEDGKEINPHIPQYMAAAPWYLNTTGPVRFRCALWHLCSRRWWRHHHPAHMATHAPQAISGPSTPAAGIHGQMRVFVRAHLGFGGTSETYCGPQHRCSLNLRNSTAQRPSNCRWRELRGWLCAVVGHSPQTGKRPGGDSLTG